ncbi:MAG TPA: acyltransferase [Polyangia bacterium]|nr:acyltransferase [Polyangia bacterium]
MSEKSTTAPAAVRLAPLDALRGLAALGVSLFSHYQHFGGNKATYPFANLLVPHWLYENSWLFVDLFFLLSGVVLTYRYLEPLGSGALDGKRFFHLRVSRLYPLHVAALCVCAAVEWTLMARHEPTVIYQNNNDLYHFTVQLFYLHTFFEHGWSFNEPSWSVSGEVLVYLLFFLYARRARASYLALALATLVVGIAVQQPGWNLPILNGLLGRAMVGFFLGSLGFLFLRELDRRGYGRAFGWACLGGLALICVLASFIGFHELIGSTPLPNALAVFPLVIFASLRVAPLARVLSWRPLTFLGDISYAVYLIHVPLQMIFLAVARERRINIPTSNPWMLAAFAAVLISAATATHYGFERPMRRWLRQRSGDVAVATDAAVAA